MMYSATNSASGAEVQPMHQACVTTLVSLGCQWAHSVVSKMTSQRSIVSSPLVRGEFTGRWPDAREGVLNDNQQPTQVVGCCILPPPSFRMPKTRCNWKTLLERTRWLCKKNYHGNSTIFSDIIRDNLTIKKVGERAFRYIVSGLGCLRQFTKSYKTMCATVQSALDCRRYIVHCGPKNYVSLDKYEKNTYLFLKSVGIKVSKTTQHVLKDQK